MSDTSGTTTPGDEPVTTSGDEPESEQAEGSTPTGTAVYGTSADPTDPSKLAEARAEYEKSLETPTEVLDAAKEQADAIAEKGLYAALESDDNAIAASDTDYIGVSPEYMNYVDSTLAPLAAEGGPEAELEKRAKDYDFERARTAAAVGFQGFSTEGLVHPSERRQPAADAIDQNRKILANQAGEGNA